MNHHEIKSSSELPVLEISGLKKNYFTNGVAVDVLKGVNFSLFRGEVLGIVGASGVGKSTLLHIAGALDSPSRGIVRHFGENVFSWRDDRISAFRNHYLGFVFQFHHLLPEFTALENVMMPCLVAGIGRSEAMREALELLERLDLSHRASHMVGHLSGGEQQRVAFARAMIRRPKLLLADEPTGNLDESTGQKVLDLIFSLKEIYGATVIVVTHDSDMIRRMDRCLRLVEGCVEELESA